MKIVFLGILDSDIEPDALDPRWENVEFLSLPDLHSFYENEPSKEERTSIVINAAKIEIEEVISSRTFEGFLIFSWHKQLSNYEKFSELMKYSTDVYTEKRITRFTLLRIFKLTRVLLESDAAIQKETESHARFIRAENYTIDKSTNTIILNNGKNISLTMQEFCFLHYHHLKSQGLQKNFDKKFVYDSIRRKDNVAYRIKTKTKGKVYFRNVGIGEYEIAFSD